ncbi:MAG: YqgE/AlgH family protein [Pseudomonadota bacterium]
MKLPGQFSNAANRDFLAGQLLIAMPNMGDPRFEHSVIFMCAHDEDHAMGVIVNKPLADLELSDLLEQLEIEPENTIDDTPVFFGGPVQTERGVVLHTLDYQLETTIMLGAEMGLTATKDVLIDIGGRAPTRPAPRKFLLAIGHAGWGAGQLEQEISMNVWAHCAPDESIIFEGAKVSSWKRALAKLGVTGAMLSPEWAAPRRDDQPLN